MRKQLLPNQLPVINEAGDIEIIDMMTGELILNVSAPDPSIHNYAFHYAKALMICQYITEGATLNDISLMEGMPPLNVIMHWQRCDRMFAEQMKQARLARSDYHHEKILDLADRASAGTLNKDQVSSIKLGTDLYKWSAEKTNPEKYGAKVTHEGSTEKPILMRVINTGINREPKPDILVVPTEEIIYDNEDSSESTDSGRSSTREGSNEVG